MVSHPLGIVFGPRGQIPTNEVLADAVQASGDDARGRGWLHLLGTASRRGINGIQRDQEDLTLANALLTEVYPGLDSDDHLEVILGAPTEGAPTGGDSGSLAEMASEAVRCNCYGEVCEDVAVSELRVRPI